MQAVVAELLEAVVAALVAVRCQVHVARALPLDASARARSATRQLGRTFLSARNDAAANVAIVMAGALTFAVRSVWPDLIVGLGIALMNADAAREVWQAAKGEHSDAEP